MKPKKLNEETNKMMQNAPSINDPQAAMLASLVYGAHQKLVKSLGIKKGKKK